MNPEIHEIIYLRTDELLDFLLEKSTPEQVFHWAITGPEINQDFLCEFFAGYRPDGKPRMSPTIPVNLQLGRYTAQFVSWAKTCGHEHGKIVPVGCDQ